MLSHIFKIFKKALKIRLFAYFQGVKIFRVFSIFKVAILIICHFLTIYTNKKNILSFHLECFILILTISQEPLFAHANDFLLHQKFHQRVLQTLHL